MLSKSDVVLLIYQLTSLKLNQTKAEVSTDCRTLLWTLSPVLAPLGYLYKTLKVSLC